MSFIKYCKSNNIESYHSGGGCIHLSYIDANNDQWLINPFDVKRSAGMGIRIFMPMFGILGVDFGHGFEPLF